MFSKKIIVIVLMFFIAAISNGQLKNNAINKPKLVVGLVIDQMRWDYLYRFENRYSTSGFKRLQNKGYSFENTLIPYIPTVTAAGHTCVYTGAGPATNGIVGNNWYDKKYKKNVYCTDDSTVFGIGNADDQGKMSPKNLYTTTITDELKLSNNFKSKTIGIALKDRGAILPAGHNANAAYWYDDQTGKWITSSYYTNALPTWVNNFNAKDEAGNFMKQNWNTLYPINSYTQSTADNSSSEQDLGELKSHTFPYKLNEAVKKKYSLFKTTPFANSFTFNFAKEAIVNENLGRNNVTDFLAISISSTDYIGHTFGPNSIEIEDTYLRLDNDIANFLQFLDTKIGANNYTVFLTADHGAAHSTNFLKENKLPSGLFKTSALETELKTLCKENFGINPIISEDNFQLYLDYDLLEKNNIDAQKVNNTIITFLKKKEYVQDAFETIKINNTTIAEPMKTRCINGYNAQRSGDIQILIKPGFSTYEKGTGHCVWNPYDAHIPLLFYGWGIPTGKTYREVYMTDIAPTLAALLQIQVPSGNVGKPLVEITK
jgi:predicted AlkP superfamily pyrophosphatase or phosphodiesterase